MNVRGHHLYLRYLAGKDDRDDEKRREFILNALLCGISATGLLSLIVLTGLQLRFNISGYDEIASILGAITSSCLLFWALSRVGHHNIAAYAFLTTMTSLLFKLALVWGFEIPSVSLGLALLITIAGVILQRRSALVTAFVLAAGLVLLGYLQSYGWLAPSASWGNGGLVFIDSMGYAVLLGLIGFVSWLANREIDYSFRLVRESKRKLAAERDQLETRVVARTEELERMQLTRMLELQRFADFGRLSAHLLHEVANPLTAAALHLELYDDKQSRALQQARKNLQQLERYVNATRNQLRTHSRVKTFSVQREIKQALAVIHPIARRANVKVVVAPIPLKLRLTGDPVKFAQIFVNIVINAIDAYDTAPGHNHAVDISLRTSGTQLTITIKDSGKGIPSDKLEQIFEPFYTTKGDGSRGLGIGLALVKQAMENDYHGSISVESTLLQGTTFTLQFDSSMQPGTKSYTNNDTEYEPPAPRTAPLAAAK